MKRKLIEHIANHLMSLKNGLAKGELREERLAKLDEIQRHYLPNGGGFNQGTRIDINKSTHDRIVFTTSYQHAKNGLHDGWTDHTIIVRPSFVYNLDVKITGRNKNNIVDYIDEVFRDALLSEI